MSATTPTDTAQTDTTRRQSPVKALLGISIGNALEWYDWNVYASFAIYFSTQVFDSSDPQSAFLQTMAVFAAGFVARPFGGVVFGWIGDRLGRKPSLLAAVLFASLGSLIIALAPTYEQMGWFASAIFVLARLLQGLAHGGELPAAQTYLAETAPIQQRGLYASAIYISGTAGQLIGLFLGLGLQFVLSQSQMNTWGWRVPFVVGAVTGLLALWIRNSMAESAVYTEHREQIDHQQEENVFIGVARNWRGCLRVITLTAGMTVAYYIWSVTMPSIAQSSFGYSSQDAFEASIIGNIVMMIALPIWGRVSDKIGRRPCMMIGLGGAALVYIPLIWLVSFGQLWLLMLAISIQLTLLAAFLSHAPATYAEMFPTGERTAGFGIAYSIAIALFGGTAGFILTLLSNVYTFALYSIVLLIISTITAYKMQESKGKDLL